MKKIMKISGMHCEKCSSRVEKTLNSIEGVKARVNLSKGQAILNISSDVSDDALRNAIEPLGFKVENISEKKGLFA